MNEIKSNTDVDNIYLDKLEFKEEDKKVWVNFFINNFRVVILLIILIYSIGIYSFLNIPRELNPEVNIPIAIITTTYPGVSPSDMEELVTKKIETAVAGISGVSKITSNSANSISMISVEFEVSEDLDKSIRKLKDEIDNVKSKLPEDASDPSVTEVSLDESPVWIFSMSGPYDGFTLKKYADDIQDELEKISGVKEVRLSGGDIKEFEIAYDPDKLLSYGISADVANQIVKSTNVVIPAGIFSTNKMNYPVRVDGRFFDVNTLSNIPIFSTTQGAIVYLSDIATIKEKAVEKTKYSRMSVFGSTPQNSINFSIIKKPGSSIIGTIDEGKKVLSEIILKLPKDMQIADNIDYAEYIERDFDQLYHDMALTIILVFGILFLLVGIKEALIASMAIPLSFAIALFTMNMTGLTLNFLSVFALLLSLGLLVDDAIVVVSATKQYMRKGKFTPEQAVLLVLKDFQFPIITTTLTTIWAFLPLALASGIMGQFLKSITITVSVALTSSAIVALMINHPLSAVLERIRLNSKMFFIFQIIIYIALCNIYLVVPSSFNVFVLLGCVFIFLMFNIIYFAKWRKILISNEELSDKELYDDELIKKRLKGSEHVHENIFSRFMHGILSINVFAPLYSSILMFLIKTKIRRILSLIVVALIFASAIYLPISGVLKSEFFPVSDGDWMYINIEMPSGYKLEETDKVVREIENRLLKYKEIATFSTVVGQPVSTSRMTSAGSSNENKASITLTLTDMRKRDVKSYELEPIIREDLKNINNADITITVPAGGPPSGSAFEARIIGEDISTLTRIAYELKDYLGSIDGVVDIDISLKPSAPEYTFSFDMEKLKLYGLNISQVSSIIKMAVDGINITDVVLEGDEIEVNARFDNSKIYTLSDLQDLQILNIQNQHIFLKDVANIQLKPSVDTITRIDQKRVVLLSASVLGKTSSVEVLKQFQQNIKNHTFPKGYDISYGGQNETNTESVQSIFYGMILTIILIITTMVIQFNSFKQSFIVLMTIPLALIGVFYGFALTGLTLSFPSLIGILALFGIVVKNAIILIDKININLRYNIHFLDAIVDAGRSRMEAVFITSITTIFGIIPITLSDETWRGLGGAIIFGLSMSSFFTLFVIPILFATIIKYKKRPI